jgi:DNA polymerase
MAAVEAVAAGEPLSVANFVEWRDAARALLAHGIAPEAVTWAGQGGAADLLMGAVDTRSGAPPAAVPAAPSKVSIPRSLMDMLANAACCRQDDRWAFLYRVVWRWTHGEHDVQSAADIDGARLHQMVKAVRREEHDMHAYIRFRERPEEAGAPRFVAWFEPAHDVLPQVAEHFVSRMGRVTWLIATPDASVM